MNDHPLPDELFQYQTRRLKELIEEILSCCQMRTAFISKKFNIPQAELRCLLLFGGERYLTVKTISQKLEVAKSRVTKIVSNLSEKNLVEITEDPNDARIRLIRLTPLGCKNCDDIGGFIWGTHRKLLTEIDTEWRKNLIVSLEQLRVGMEAVKKDLM